MGVSLSTASRDVSTTTASSATGTHSCASTGRTWRNQPAAPATANTAPRMLTGAAVTIPAHTSINPNATTMGHAVGAGTSILLGMFITSPLLSNDINDQEDYDPDRIDEVPIHR